MTRTSSQASPGTSPPSPHDRQHVGVTGPSSQHRPLTVALLPSPRRQRPSPWRDTFPWRPLTPRSPPARRRPPARTHPPADTGHYQPQHHTVAAGRPSEPTATAQQPPTPLSLPAALCHRYRHRPRSIHTASSVPGQRPTGAKCGHPGADSGRRYGRHHTSPLHPRSGRSHQAPRRTTASTIHPSLGRSIPTPRSGPWPDPATTPPATRNNRTTPPEPYRTAYRGTISGTSQRPGTRKGDLRGVGRRAVAGHVDYRAGHGPECDTRCRQVAAPIPFERRPSTQAALRQCAKTQWGGLAVRPGPGHHRLVGHSISSSARPILPQGCPRGYRTPASPRPN